MHVINTMSLPADAYVVHEHAAFVDGDEVLTIMSYQIADRVTYEVLRFDVFNGAVKSQHFCAFKRGCQVPFDTGAALHGKPYIYDASKRIGFTDTGEYVRATKIFARCLLPIDLIEGADREATATALEVGSLRVA